MKVTCQRDGLLTACQLVSAAVAARTTQPVLSNVKATAEDCRLVDDGRDHVFCDSVIRSMIHRTVFEADKKDAGARFALTGVLWEAEGKTARLVATDSKRLALCEGPATLYGPPESAKTSHLVPAKT